MAGFVNGVFSWESKPCDANLPAIRPVAALPAKRPSLPATPPVLRAAPLAGYEDRLGTAAWQTGLTKRLRKFQPGDFWLGYGEDGTPLGVNDDRHAAVVAGTRSDKGVSVVVPNLALWPGSLFAVDPKGENAIVTARRRGAGSRYCYGLGQRVHILDPFGLVRMREDSFADLKASFNPLDLIDPAREGSVDIAARIADALMVKPLAQAEPFWIDSARDIVKFLCLHVATAAGIPANRRNLRTVRAMLLAGDASAARIAALFEMGTSAEGHKLLFKDMQRNPAFGGLVARAGAWLAAIDQKADKTFFGALQTAVTNTSFLDSPQMARCVETSTFRLADLKADPGGVSIYVCLPFQDYDIHGGWVRMVTTLAIGELQRSLARPASGHRVLLALDEFPSLGRLKSAEHAIAQIAGYGVKMLLISQTLAQYQDAYRENWQTFLGNCGTKLFFGIDDLFTQSYVSQTMGEREVVRTAQSESKTWGHSTGTSYSSAHGATHGESWSVSMKGMDISRTHGGSVGFSSTTTYGRNESASHSRAATVSETIHKRPLMTTDEIAWRFSQEDRPAMLALISGHRPLIVRRVRYFAWDWFGGKFDPAPGHPKPRTLAALDAERAAKAEADRLEREAFQRKQMAMRARQDALGKAQRARHEEELRREDRRSASLRWIYRAAFGGAVIGAILAGSRFL